MAENENPKSLEEQARDAVLSLIKKVAEESERRWPAEGANAREIAAAYAFATGKAVPNADAVTKLVGKMVS